MSPSLSHLWDHRAVLYRATTATDVNGDLAEGWTAQTSPSGLNARPDETWEGPLTDFGPGDQGAQSRRWFLDSGFSAIRERDVLDIVTGPETGKRYRVLAITRATNPKTLHHIEVKAEAWFGGLTPP